MITTLGWAGSLLLALCAIPQAYKSYTEKRTVGVSIVFLWMWLAGEVMAAIYVYWEKYSLPLMLNYISNIILILIIMWFSYFPKQTVITNKKSHMKETEGTQ